MIDGGLRSLFGSRLRQLGYHCQAIETGGVGLGVPDFECCSPDGVQNWIEFKRTSANAVRLSPEQVGWALQRARVRGNIYIAVRKRCSAGKRRVARDELWIIHGSSAALLKDHGLSNSELRVMGIWSGGPRNWSWVDIDRILRGK